MSVDEHSHLRRLDRVWVRDPVYFVTTCTHDRRGILTHSDGVKFLVDEWRQAKDRHGWQVGRYVVMPDHVHFFCSGHREARRLQTFVGKWKEWTSKRLVRDCGLAPPVWQPGFFDRVLRTSESYSEKWDYVRNNPVRAGLVTHPDDWPHQGHVHFM